MEFLRHSTKAYVVVGVSAFLLGYISGNLAGMHKMKKKMRREKIAAEIKKSLRKQDVDDSMPDVCEGVGGCSCH